MLASKTAKTIISSSEDDIVTAQSIDAANIETVSSSDSDDCNDDTLDFDTDGVKIKSGKGKKSKKKISISEIMADRSLTLYDKHESSSTDTDVADEPGDKMQGNKKVVKRSKGSTPTKNKPISGKTSQRQTTTSRGRTSSGSGKKVTQSKNAKETVQAQDQTSQRTGKGKATGQPQNAGKQIFTGAQARKRILSSGSEDSDSNCVEGDIPLSQLPNSSSKTKQNLNTGGGISAAAQNKRRKS